MEATGQDSNIAKISEENFVYIRTIQDHTGGMTVMPELMGYVSIPYNWKEFIFHRGCSFDHWSIPKLDLWPEGRKANLEDKPSSSNPQFFRK